MNRTRSAASGHLCAALALCLGICLAGQARAAGTLVIAGGALRGDNAAVYRAFIDALPPAGVVAIVPAASGSPTTSARSAAEDLRRHGLAAERLQVYPLALRDDAGTPGVDESRWARNAWDMQRVQALGRPAGIWFTGGDQMRILQAMQSEGGNPSPLLTLIRQRLGEGAVIGGTSAGAAIMSRHMITGGNSFDALLAEGTGDYAESEADESGRVSLHPGLGFLPAGLVDQHFDRRARLGRLVRALAETGEAFGYGVDENTALVVELDSGTGRVLGPGSVAVLDTREAAFGFGGDRLANGLRLSVIPAGVTFALDAGSIAAGQGRPTRGDEYYSHSPLDGGGMALPNPRLNQLLGNDLLDNRRAARLRRLSCDDGGRGLRYDFSQDQRSQGYWLEAAEGEAYAIEAVRLDILRVPGACRLAVQADR